jgi:bacteriocin-like protein
MKPGATKSADQTSKPKKPEAKIEGSEELNDADLNKVTGGALDSYAQYQATKQGKFKN